MNTTFKSEVTTFAGAAGLLPRGCATIMFLISACAWLGLAGLAQAQIMPPGGPENHAPRELLIKFKRGSSEQQLADAVRAGGITKVLKHFTFKDPNQQGITHVSTRLDVRQALRMLGKHPAVEYAEPNYKIYPAVVPNDPRFSDLWGLHNIGGQLSVADADIDAPEAWDMTTGNSGVLIGVLDTGIDISHVDLAANIWTNPDEVPNDGIDNDGNGYVDDVNGWDWWNGDNTVYDPVDGDLHGTHVAGTIGATGNNGIGVVGVNWQAKMLPLKFIGPEFGTLSGVIQAINYAAAKGVKVLNASFGGAPFSQSFQDAIQAAGILFVASAGNDGKNNDTTPHYPSGYDLPNVIAVAATTKQDKLARFSNYGATSVDLGAPGVAIVSTIPGNSYTDATGTSMAAPHVTGVAGLIYARFPGLSSIQVKDRIMAGVDPVSGLSGKTLTGGRLNAAKALFSVDSPPSVAITSPADGAVVFGAIIVSATASDDQGVANVSFYLDNGTLLAIDTEAPYEINWDSRSVEDGTHSISAVASDTSNQSASHTVNVLVDNYNDWPVANAGADQTVADDDGDGVESVTLDGSASFDFDGTIAAYQWSDGTTVLGNTATLSLTLGIGSYTFTLTVTDDEGATSTDTVNVTVTAAPDTMHSGDLDGTSSNSGSKWLATVTAAIHDGHHNPVQGATVTIQWSNGFNGTASATTGSDGRCTFSTGLINKGTSSVTLTITGATHATLIYDAGANHDLDGDSNGTSISVNKP